MRLAAFLFALVPFAVYAAAHTFEPDAPLAVPVLSGTFTGLDGGEVVVEPLHDGGQAAEVLNIPMLMQTAKRIAGCEAKVAVYADAGDESDRTLLISVSSAVIVGIGLGYAAGRLAEKK